MNCDYEAKELKVSSLIGELSTCLVEQGINSEDAKDAALKLLDLIANVAPPEKEIRSMALVLTSSYSGAGGGKSTKPGNVKINLVKLIGGLASGSLVFVGGTGALPAWAFVMAAISLWTSLKGITTVNVTENEVAVLLTLWSLKDSDNVVHKSDNDIHDAANSYLTKQGRNGIGIADIRVAIQNLSKIGSIKPSRSGGWFVAEWVKVRY
jgi:hypothetical protein